MTRRPLALLVPLLLAVAASPLAAAEPPATTIDSAIEVREALVPLDRSTLPPLESMGRRGPADFLVLLDGAAGEVVGWRSAEESDPPTLLLWFDGALAGPATRAAAARRLTEAWRRIADVADPELDFAGRGGVDRRPGLAHDAAAGELGRRARLWERSEDRSLRVPLAERLAALDLLVTTIADAPADRPTVVWLVLDPLPRPATLELLADGDGPPGGPLARRLDDTARALAAYGVSLNLLAPRPGGYELDRRGNAEEGEATTTGGRPSRFFAMFRWPCRRRTPIPEAAARLELATDPSIQPLERFVAPTAGIVAATADSVVDQTRRLAAREQLIVRLPTAAPGRLHTLAIRWSGGDARLLPGPAAFRSGVPPQVAAARLRAADGGRIPSSVASGDLPVDRDDGSVCVRATGSPRWLRRSWIDAGGEPVIEASNERAAGEPACYPWPGGARLVLVEDVETGDHVLLPPDGAPAGG